MRLTAASVSALKLDTGVADKIVFDDNVPGFGVRVRASGARTWIYQYKVGGGRLNYRTCPATGTVSPEAEDRGGSHPAP